MLVSRQDPTIRLRRWLRQFLVCVSLVAIIYFFGQPQFQGPSSALAQSVNVPDALPLATTLTDFHLPGTQPNTLTDPLVTCTGCHVDHLNKSYSGSMMANSARDPLFRAALRIANEDASFAGEFCIRCHVPNAWLNGRSTPADGSAFTNEDMQGVTCNACHRMVPAVALTGEASEDTTERDNIFATTNEHPIIGSGAYVVDRQDRRRGPFDVVATHNPNKPTVNTPFMRDSLMCATCHTIDNPLYSYNDTAKEFVLNDLGQKAPATDKLFPVERTYTEWEFSQFNTPAGVPDLAAKYPGGERTAGTITVCQDCHMPLEDSKLTGNNALPTRTLGVHEYAGGSSFIQAGLDDFWDGQANDTYYAGDPVAQQATLDSRSLGSNMLERAATIGVSVKDREVTFTITNNTGHKLPTGYAEGRRMWLELILFKDGNVLDDIGTVNADGTLDRPVKVWEIKQGISDSAAQALGRPDLAGEGFHFALNNKVFFDNRIPPRGWTKSDYEENSMLPVGAGVNYAEGQYTDSVKFILPAGIDEVDVKLMYQAVSGEYFEFLTTEADDLVDDNIVTGGKVNWGQVVAGLATTFPITREAMVAFNGTSVPNLGITKNVAPSGDLLPGQPIEYTINFSATSVPDMKEVSLADQLPAGIVDVTVQNTPNSDTTLVQNTDAPDLTWTVTGDLPSHEKNPDNNVIKISGKIDPAIHQVTDITNTITISGFAQIFPNNIIFRQASATSQIVPPVLSFNPASYTVGESGGTVKVTLKLDKKNPYADTTFEVSTEAASAFAGSDFTPLNGKIVTILKNQTSVQVTIQIKGDSKAENSEFFKVNLANAQGAIVSQNSSAQVTITDDDPGDVDFNFDQYVPAAKK